jgi:SAM-dependent methyltransferase
MFHHNRTRSAVLNLGDLEQLFEQKYGRSNKVGWAPLRRHHWGYYLPADVYEACVSKLVFDGCSWVDIGGGHSIFPDNPALARSLVSRCSLVVAVDPSENVKNNDFVHRCSQCLLEDYYQADVLFDLATLRMVVEHVDNPSRFMLALQGILRPGGIVVVFTVSKMSPISLLARLIPFRLHHPIKQFFWGGDEEDTFPVHYKMNAPRVLRSLFTKHGFEEVAFAYLDDLSTFARFPYLNRAELVVWKVLSRVGLKYPESCLLGVYKKSDD